MDRLFLRTRAAPALCASLLAALSAMAGEPSVQPSQPDAGDAVRGARVYRQFCQHCHGPNLVNPGTVSFDLRRLQPDEYTRFSTSVSNGKGNMPPWKATLKDGDLPALWAYIMHNRGN
ncbi:cytochrome c [Duganella sp. FT92W]|uniref:Cytochrome c n=1 Tax=Pseudoduganella rivuli TaxID=2666085 RepID=A0A7X2ILN3_9BURK|nr:cytochrome c [Pseudoduganella rivuli]MRV71753.1 cytochrome c [Pseudoduganella rivuli]